jgi:hypothetical protein
MLCGRFATADVFMAGAGIIPESQVTFSATLAATIGLEEAVLAQQIQGLYQHLPATRTGGLSWLHVSRSYLQQLLPFWAAGDLERVCDSLEAQGLLHRDRRVGGADSLLFALSGSGDPAAAQPDLPGGRAGTASASAEPAARKSPARVEGQPLPPDFTPSEDMLELLERFHNVPRDFALQQLEDFTLYWRERGSGGHAWQNKFRQHVLFHWAKYQQGQGASSGHTGQRGTDPAGRTRNRSLEQDLTDTSWAD